MMYTYLLGWSKHNVYYYGVRYSKKADTNELWVKYKTSSKHVKNFSNKHGAPDIIEIRRIFTDRDKAINWENKVLRRMNVVKDKRFLNATDNKAIPITDHIRGTNLKFAKKFHDWDIASQNSVRESSRQQALRLWKSGKLTGKKNCTSENYKLAANLRWSDSNFRNQAKSRKWITNGINALMVLPEQMTHYIDNGWVLGRGVT